MLRSQYEINGPAKNATTMDANPIGPPAIKAATKKQTSWPTRAVLYLIWKRVEIIGTIAS